MSTTESLNLFERIRNDRGELESDDPLIAEIIRLND